LEVEKNVNTKKEFVFMDDLAEKQYKQKMK